jgi:hypothetical protein
MRFCAAVGAFLVCAPISNAVAARAILPRVSTAGELAEMCAANPTQELGDAKINYCHGFAQGAVDVISHYQSAKKTFCFPKPTPTRTETMLQFSHWVHANPAHARFQAAAGLYQFLNERYPCGK